MANRFPLAVNKLSNRIEEVRSGDNLDLTNNGIIIDGDTGVSGQYLKSNGTGNYLSWDNPGDVYLTGVQTVADKIFTNCSIDGSQNTLTNISNNSLENDFITIDGQAIPLGGSITTTRVGVDGSSLNYGDITLFDSGSVTLSQVTDGFGNTSITINATDTVTRLKGEASGSFVSGDITLVSSGSVSITQSGSQITISATDTNTITRLRTDSNQYLTGNISLTAGSGTTLTQDTANSIINISSKNYTTTDLTVVAFPSATDLSIGSSAGQGETTIKNSLVVEGGFTTSVPNNFTDSLQFTGNVLTVNSAGFSNIILGQIANSSAINTWSFPNVALNNGESFEVTLILTTGTGITYGSSAVVNTIAVATGVDWPGGAPPTASSNAIDILKFLIVKDNSGVTRVFGSSTTNYS